ncbi:unnamed protein product [Brassica oleracea var. botrytis]
MALASCSDPVCVRVDTGRGTTFGVLDISIWFIHLSATNNQILSDCSNGLRLYNLWNGKLRRLSSYN